MINLFLNIFVSIQIIASWGDEQINAEQFNRYLGADAHYQQTGIEALSHILRLQLVTIEAKNQKIEIGNEEVQRRIAEARKQIETAGMSLDLILKERNIGLEEFEKLIEDSILHEKLVRKSLKLEQGTPLTSEQLANWSDQKLNSLLEMAKQAPPGMALDAPPFRVTEAELGEVVRRTMSKAELQERIEQLVLSKALPKWASDNRIVLTDDILNQEIQWRRERVKNNPAYGGATYEGLLKAKGSSLKSVLESEELRIAGYVRLLSKELMPDSFFNDLNYEQKQKYEALYGESRQVGWILIRASDEPETELDLDFEGAEKELLTLRKLIKDENDFYQVAKDYSEDELSRRRGGMLGWIHRNEKGIQKDLCDAVFNTTQTGIYGPIKIEKENAFDLVSGMALIMVKDIKEVASKHIFYEKIRRGSHNDIRKNFLKEIGLETIYDSSN